MKCGLVCVSAFSVSNRVSVPVWRTVAIPKTGNSGMEIHKSTPIWSQAILSFVNQDAPRFAKASLASSSSPGRSSCNKSIRSLAWSRSLLFLPDPAMKRAKCLHPRLALNEPGIINRLGVCPVADYQFFATADEV